MPAPEQTAAEKLHGRRAAALNAALITAGHSGNCVLLAGNRVMLDPPFTAEHQQLADGWDWTDAGDLIGQRGAAVELALSGADPQAIGTRASLSAAFIRGNSQAEVVRALMGLCGFTAQQIADRIAVDREIHPPTPGAPTPADAVALSTMRLGASTILAMIAGYIAAGAGDPPAGSVPGRAASRRIG